MISPEQPPQQVRLPLPSGVGVALVTMFSADGSPDIEATAARAGACVALGVSSVLVAGTTGEASRLGAHDRIALASAVREVAPGVPVVVGTGDREAARGLAIAAEVAKSGVADALLAYPAHDSVLAAYFEDVHGAADGVPVLAYHNPALDVPEVAPRALASLSESGVVAGIKDSSSSTNRLAELIGLGAVVYVGSPTQAVLAGSCGAAGAFLAVANVVPRMCIAAWEGSMQAQRELFAVHLRAVADFPRYLKEHAPGSLAG